MKAILSDIHGNLEALTAVLDDIARHQIEVIYNLGDITGYGPNPIECIERSMNMNVVLLGNFELAALTEPMGFGANAERSILWTKKVLESRNASSVASQHPRDFLASLPSSHQDEHVLYVHGSPRRPTAEYVFPECVYNRKKMQQIGEHFDGICFNGHTHQAGIFIEKSLEEWEFISPMECDGVFKLDGRKVMCNVGSVGQPRDGDWRAGYVLFDGTTIHFHRVEYDLETTIKKIYDEPALAHFSGDRLREGG